MPTPTVAQVKRYLSQSNWRPQSFGDGTTAWHSPAGLHQVMLGSSDADTLSQDGAVLRTIASATGRTLEQVRADVIVDQEDFSGCNRRCWPRLKPPAEWAHTLRWGDCAKAEPPPVKPAHFDIPVTWTADDGYPSAGWASVPLALFAPWAGHLPPEDQHAMLAEVAGAKPELRPGIVADWQRTAEQLADPLRREVLLGENAPSDFVEAPRPGGAK